MPGLIEPHDDLTGAVQQVSLLPKTPHHHLQFCFSRAPRRLDPREMYAASTNDRLSPNEADVEVMAEEACLHDPMGLTKQELD